MYVKPEIRIAATLLGAGRHSCTRSQLFLHSRNSVRQLAGTGPRRPVYIGATSSPWGSGTHRATPPYLFADRTGLATIPFNREGLTTSSVASMAIF